MPQTTTPSTTPTAPRSRPPAFTITEAAAAQIKHLRAQNGGEDMVLMVGLKEKGCAGLKYDMEFVEPDAVPRFSEIVTQHGVTIAISPEYFLRLIGTEMDFVSKTLASEFVFNNPNQTGACGCGESVSIKPCELNQG